MKYQKTYKVVMIKALIKGYRKPFFNKLRAELLKDGIQLTVLYGLPDSGQNLRKDNIELDSSMSRRVYSKYLFNEKFLFQWIGWRNIFSSDLIIIVNASRNIINIPLLLLSRLGVIKVSLWGHGYNYQGKVNLLSEKIKRVSLPMAYWWFAYTDDVASYVSGFGFDKKRITTINNSIDTTSFRNEIQALNTIDIKKFRKKIGILDSYKVGIYCGALYDHKRISFLLDAAINIHKKCNDFRLLILGSGIDSQLVIDASLKYDFIKYLGPVFGRDKAFCYKISDFVLNPGLVGLGVLDSFAAGKPLLSMTDSLHSPEISYLENNVNGRMVDGYLKDYVACVLDLINNQELLKRLSTGALESSRLYTLENMVSNVRSGIESCLDIRL
jgi:L-malate glycosyltransferase